jgi:type II restriction/modification system DNA methylase subunit YeeA
VTPDQFIAKWKVAELKERSAAQSHFIDLCRMLDEPAPTDADPTGEWYAFERGATKITGGEGWADVWKRGYFGWEYKGKRKDLDAAFAQLQQYALALENPPLLVVCDLNRFRIRTNWTNSISVVHEFALDDLRDAAVRQKLKWVLSDPERLKPRKTRQALTEQAAAEFAKLAQRLRERGHPSETVAHFINRLVFCMFAEDVDLLPNKMFQRMLEHTHARSEEFETMASDLFRAMKAGGRIGFEHVAWFNGGLFNDDAALPLDKDDITLTLRAAGLDWAEIDPSILGTLFERGLDPDKRSQLGAHYTDRDKIMLIVAPVIVRPWLAEWEATKADITAAFAKALDAKSAGAKTKARDQAVVVYRAFLDRLRAFRVLDPACGSGNFLYLALLALKDLEHRASIEAEAMGLQREFPQIGPASVKGIEINRYAAELARVSVWIGEIQWMRRNGFGASRDPILKPLETIECRDALLNPDGMEAEWPNADVIVGNPPFLGNKKMLRILGEKYVTTLRRTYSGRVPTGANLVMYWFQKAWESLATTSTERAGLVGTQAIRRGASRRVLDTIVREGRIFDAWDDEPWVVDGAAVRVSVVSFDKARTGPVRLDGQSVECIASDLVATSETKEPEGLEQNSGVCFQGTISGGPFEVPGDQAREWLSLPLNPNQKPNSPVLRPWSNADDLTGRPSDTWIIDFGTNMPLEEAMLFQEPFGYLESACQGETQRRANDNEPPLRDGEPRTQARWWMLQRPRPRLRSAVSQLERFISTPRVAKFRTFVWLNSMVLPDTRLVVIARDDDVTFGILQSRPHELWALRYGARHGVGNDPEYVHTKTFETFPFPEGLTPNIPASSYVDDPRAVKIAEAAKRLNELREAWLNPPDLVKRVPEVVPGFPDRILPVDDKAATILKKRTLTNLYNERPTWLANAHRVLDAAVAAAYGWPADISEDDALARLFALNQSRADRSPNPRQPSPSNSLRLH